MRSLCHTVTARAYSAKPTPGKPPRPLLKSELAKLGSKRPPPLVISLGASHNACISELAKLGSKRPPPLVIELPH